MAEMRMAETLKPDLCILGESAAGLHAAFLAAAFGVPVILVTGRAADAPAPRDTTLALYTLRAIAMTAASIRKADRLGLDAHLGACDPARILAHIRATEQTVAPRAAFARFRALGVRIIESEARFENPTCLRAGDVRIASRRFIIAGAQSGAPALPQALTDFDHLTLAQLFDAADSLPSSLAIFGRDGAALALAQALARLSITTTLIADGDLLPGEDPEQTAIVTRALTRDGVAIHTQAEVQSAARDRDGSVRLALQANGHATMIEAAAFLATTAARPAFDDMGLAAAGIGSSAAGIRVDHRLRTDNPAIYAIGPVAALPFNATLHSGQTQAECAIKQILFRLPVSFQPRAMARIIATDPEMAAVGLTEDEARRDHGAIAVLRSPLAGNDRARAEGRPEGHAKIILDRRGRVLGASLTGDHAASLITPWAGCLGNKPEALKAARAPYPSLAETPARALAESYAPLARNRMIRMASAFLRRWG